MCEGRDAEMFLIHYLESKALAKEPKFANEIQVLDFGGNDELRNFLVTLQNMDGFERVKSIAVIRDAESDFSKACREVTTAFKQAGFAVAGHCGEWVHAGELSVGYMLFPLNEKEGTLEDLCLHILSEQQGDKVLTTVDDFLKTMEVENERRYSRRHKNRLHTYLASSDAFVTMPIGLAAKAGAFDWKSNVLEPLKLFLRAGL